jgi:hypothetical protein
MPTAETAFNAIRIEGALLSPEFEHRFVKALADAVGLRALGLGARIIDVLDGEVKLIFVPLRVATILACG